MSDLIYRQDAIDAVNVGNLHRGIKEALQSILEELPSAQLEKVCMVNMTLSEEQLREMVENAKNEILQVLPSEQLEPRWIPCSERLPKTDNWRTTFNVTTETGGVVSMEWENTTVRGKPVSRWIWQDRIAPWKVVAWMPLPEPFRSESEDKE